MATTTKSQQPKPKANPKPKPKTATRSSRTPVKSCGPVLPEYLYGEEKGFAPRFSDYRAELKTYTPKQKKELLRLAVMHVQVGLVRALLNSGVKPAWKKLVANKPGMRAATIRDLLDGETSPGADASA